MLRFFYQLSFRGKITFILTWALGFALVITSTLLLGYQYVAQRNNLVLDVTTLADMVGQACVVEIQFEDPDSLEENTLASLRAHPLILAVGVYREGRLWADYEGEQPADGPTEHLPEKQPEAIPYEFSPGHLTLSSAIIDPDDESKLATLFMIFSTKELQHRLLKNAGVMAIVLALSLGVATLVGARLQRRVIRPILNLAQTTREISANNDYSLRAEKRHNDELGALVESVNEMLEQIESQDAKLRSAAEQLELANKDLESKVRRRTVELSDAMQAAQEARDVALRANQAKSQFLANMSHEIRTPMNAILGYAQILEREADMPPEHRQKLETIQKSGDHLMAMINDILDLSKIEAGRMELQGVDFDLVALISGMESMFQFRCEQKNLEFRMDLGGGLDLEGAAPVHGDEGKLRQILINLLGNAVKFTDQGSVTLKVHRTSGDTQFIQHEEGENSTYTYHFEVVDTGAGIETEAQAKIFDPFQQGEVGRSKGGTGLGLAISKSQLALMKSNLRLESKINEGTKFSFDLSFTPAKEKVESRQKEPEREIIGLQDDYAVHALVVDDVKENRDVLAEMLTSIGCRVAIAEDGPEALQEVAQEIPDIIFLDIQMPKMTGTEVAQKVLDLYGERAPKLVAVSASVLRHQQERYLEVGFKQFIRKPVRFQEICQCLRDILQVQYRYSDGPEPVSTAKEIDYSQVNIPRAQLVELKSYAEQYWSTEFKKKLADLTTDSPELEQLKKQLAEFLDLGDMEPIVQLLEKILGPHQDV